MILKQINSIVSIAMTVIGLQMGFSSCGDDDDANDDSGNVQPTTMLTLRQQSIQDGAEVNAETTTLLTLTYNQAVTVSPSANITLNGTRITASSNKTTALMVDIALSLEKGQSYRLHIPQGSFIATKDAKAVNPELTLNFTTKADPKPVDPNISTTPVIASTEQALRLYTYMLSQYGQKTISSVMADVNWNNDIAEKVKTLTGKYPAMNCYDFIHICFSPANWINYDDITPVSDWVNAGGLVQLMWHFNVPKSQGATDYTCTPSETTFKAANVLVDGTWEHTWFYDQMDKVVSVILKLQDAGIAATWRPFHEAAGNSTAIQQANWTKAWFWWGYDGADTYKKIWITMFDYFKNKGIRNLIWVWTTQNYNSNSDSYRQDTDWYPGTEYVDIVARDLYGSTAQQNVQEFNEIQAAYPNKMVTLGECGYGTANGSRIEHGLISDCFTLGAKWSSFMVWYQGGQGSTNSMVSDAWWRDAMKSSVVITRDQVAY